MSLSVPSATNPLLRELRVLIAHDWLVTWAGSERCVEQLVQIFPQADIVVGLRAPHIRDLNEVTRRARETWLGRLPGAHTHHRWFLPLEGLAFASLDTSKYDLVISSSHAFSKMVRARKDTIHLSYCYTPPRYLWDLQEAYARDASWVQRTALRTSAATLRAMDKWSASRVTEFVAISRFVSDRIERCYGRTSSVVYPPVAPKTNAKPTSEREHFLLHLGRLVGYKRVDLAVEASKRLNIPLVVAGDGPERSKLEAMAGPATRFVGAVSEAEAADLLNRCSAFVFSAEEDFGIAPLEANLHGAPVIGFAKGGLAETMVHGETAELFDEQSVSSLTQAIDGAMSRTWDNERLVQNGQRFSPARFRTDMESAVLSCL